MGKELYVYSPIYSSTVELINKQLSSVSDDEDLLVRLNSPGGEVNAGFAFLSKLSERTSKTKAIIDGQAKSMAAYWLPFFNHVTSNDTSELMFHKAAYAEWYKPTEAEQESLERTNKIFKDKITAKVQGKKGSEGFLAKLFEEGKRNDVELTPQQAKDLGIVDEVRTLEVQAYSDMQIVAMFNEGEQPEKKKKPQKEGNNNQIRKSMDLVTLKTEHAVLYAQILQEGFDNGVKAEKDRVEAWAVYNEVDPEKVKAGIESGEALTAKAMAEFNLQVASGEKVKAIEGEAPGAIKTPEPTAETEEEKQAKADKALLDQELGEIKTY